jgi:hypothetical protein
MRACRSDAAPLASPLSCVPAIPSELCTRPVRSLCTVMQVDEEEPVAPDFQPPCSLDASAERAPWEPPSEPAARALFACHQRRAYTLLEPADELAGSFAPAPSPQSLPITVPCEAGFEDEGSTSARDGESPTASFGAAASPAKADVGSASTQDAELPLSASFGAAAAPTGFRWCPPANSASGERALTTVIPANTAGGQRMPAAAVDPHTLKVTNFPKVYNDRPGLPNDEDLRALLKPYNYKSIEDVYVPKRLPPRPCAFRRLRAVR